MRRLAALVPALVFLGLIGVFAGYLIAHRTPQVIPRAMVGKPAPAESLPPLEGGAPVALSSATAGPTLINFYVDGNLYWSVNPSMLPGGATWVFDQPFFILLNFAVGGNWPGNPDGSSSWPQQMLVDYVRVYEAQ